MSNQWFSRSSLVNDLLYRMCFGEFFLSPCVMFKCTFFLQQRKWKEVSMLLLVVTISLVYPSKQDLLGAYLWHLPPGWWRGILFNSCGLWGGASMHPTCFCMPDQTGIWEIWRSGPALSSLSLLMSHRSWVVLVVWQGALSCWMSHCHWRVLLPWGGGCFVWNNIWVSFTGQRLSTWININTESFPGESWHCSKMVLFTTSVRIFMFNVHGMCDQSGQQ